MVERRNGRCFIHAVQYKANEDALKILTKVYIDLESRLIVEVSMIQIRTRNCHPFYKVGL